MNAGTCVACLAMTVALVRPAAEAVAMDLVRDGEAQVRIVLPAETEYDRWVPSRRQWLADELARRNPDADQAWLKQRTQRVQRSFDGRVKRTGDEEELAAQELREIVKAIGGAELAIERPEKVAVPDGPAVLLGAAFARAAGLGERIDALDEDGYICVVQGDKLVLAGRRARGTLYAVYHLLESLGCRWVMPGDFGALYPSSATLSTAIDVTENPDHTMRYWWCTYGHADGYERWTLRNRGNFVPALGDARVAQGHHLGQPLKWAVKQEAYRVKKMREVRERRKGEDGQTEVVTAEKEVWALPDDYYALTDGKLNFHVPNFSNPKVWDLYADYYIQWFDARPGAEYASMSAEDGFVTDQRPASLKLRSNEYDFMMGAFSATDPLWFFLNRVIERVAEVYPDKKFGVLVYSNNMAPPRLERVNPRMALVFAPLGVSPLHHVRDPQSKTNRVYREWLEDWMLLAGDAGAETYYYDYEPMGYVWNMALICPRWHIIGENYPWFHELGLDGHTTQGYDDWAACGLDNYLMIRLYWDADLDYREVIADYCAARFGAAAPVMVEYYRTLEQRMREVPDLYSNEYWDNHLILTPEVRAVGRTLIEAAAAAADTERAKAHVETMAALQRSTDAFCDAVEHSREAGDFGAAAEMIKPVFEVRDELNALYPNFMNATRTDPEKKTAFFTGGIYHQFLAFDERIDGAKAALALPRHWKGMLDTRGHAAARGLHEPGADVSGLEDFDVTVHPDVRFNTQREVAAFFYRTEVEVPASFEAADVTLYFPALVAKAMQIWVNGAPVSFDLGDYRDTIWRGPERFWIDYDHRQSFDLTGYVKPGERNVIAFRAFKSFDFGGPYRRIFLLAE